jgi:hypothetical protein
VTAANVNINTSGIIQTSGQGYAAGEGPGAGNLYQGSCKVRITLHNLMPLKEGAMQDGPATHHV